MTLKTDLELDELLVILDNLAVIPPGEDFSINTDAHACFSLVMLFSTMSIFTLFRLLLLL